MTASNVISNIVNRLKLQKDELEHSSFYREIPIGGDKLLVVRVSNHRTHLQTWADRYTKTLRPNKKMQRRMGENLPKVYRQKMFYSFVFEDENTVGNTEVNNGQVIVVLETVKNAQNLTDIQVSQIIDALSTFMTNQHYNENILGRLETITNKIQENNNKQINTNKTVMKLNESQLRNIIKESVKKVLKEYNSTFMSSTERAAQEFIDAFDSNEPEKSDFKTMERAMNHMSAYDFVGVDKYEMNKIREINKTLRKLGLYY